ncbi:peptide deformylase [Pseudogulbenkiania sp. MAI-1]|uniref:peptide deformylase n=1 Tax=Pseudogulbenkiania sp. MAI-1 TaxID=990370 RepID=UPI00045E960E|nr:peptide deformylase [Pseudogulbenkiania sp. MAI-1]
MKRDFLPQDHPMLRQHAAPVTAFDTPELHDLVQDMFDTQFAGNGVGLAAPQIGVPLRVIVFAYAGGERAPGAPEIPPTVLINPEITPESGQLEEDWEGCFSVPGRREQVPRWHAIRYRAQDLQGSPVEGRAEGFHARIIQHEVDHLNGTLFIDRLPPGAADTPPTTPGPAE